MDKIKHNHQQSSGVLCSLNFDDFVHHILSLKLNKNQLNQCLLENFKIEFDRILKAKEFEAKLNEKIAIVENPIDVRVESIKNEIDKIGHDMKLKLIRFKEDIFKFLKYSLFYFK